MEEPELFKTPVDQPPELRPSVEFKPVATSDWCPLAQPVRRLQIEAVGDFWKGLIKPRIRLTGRWLERAGFTPGQRVEVTCLAPGILELRAPMLPTVSPTPKLSAEACRSE